MRLVKRSHGRILGALALACLVHLVTTLLAACNGGVQPLQPAQQPRTEDPQAIVVRLQGALGTVEAARCQRALRWAEASGMEAVVFHLDSAGGIEDATAESEALHERVLTSPVKTIAWVSGKATGGAAHLAILCDQVWFAPGAELGAIDPVDIPLEELLGLAPEDAAAQRMAAFRAEVLGQLARSGRKLGADALQLCAGMADPSLVLRRVEVTEGGIDTMKILSDPEIDALRKAGTTVRVADDLSRPVMVDGRLAQATGLGSGIVTSVEELGTDQLLLPAGALVEITPNWSEHAVSWLELLQPVLLVMGLTLLVLEVKTPGVGLLGVLGVMLLSLALLHGWLVGLAEAAEILMFFLGLAAIAVEVFLLPGTVFFGATGLVCLAASLVLSNQGFVLPRTLSQDEILLDNLVRLLQLFAMTFAGTFVMWRLLPHLPFFRNLFQPAPAAASATGASTQFGALPTAASDLVGRTGRAATTLRPAGVMESGQDRLDVVTDGEFLEAGTPVRVVQVEGNRIVVARDEAAATRASERGEVGMVVLIAVVGIALLVAEVFFVSFGVLSVMSGTALIGAVFLAFQESTAFGVTLLVAEAIAAPLAVTAAFKLMPRTRLGKAIILDAPRHEDVSAGAEDASLRGLLHKEGTTLSVLRPAGYARIEGRRIDVVTRGEMLDEGVPIRVLEVSANRVVVAATGPAASS
ncbi:MAG: hypothetical protein RIT25_3153 [Planctomycetota bacterium]